MVRAHIFIRGFVQGVGFRWWMQRMARRIGVKG
ncbi:MAG: acylphosphatase, partial [Thermofilaceae archaeon]